MLAASYPNDDERGAAVGLAMGASALGVLGNYEYFTLIIIIIFINLYSANYYYYYYYYLYTYSLVFTTIYHIVITKLPNSKFKIKNSKFFRSQMIGVLQKHYTSQRGFNFKNGHTVRSCPQAQN